MTEEEWLNSTYPVPLISYLWTGGVPERKSRLLGVACCRRIWDILTDPRSRGAVEVAERFTDGLASVAELARSHGNAQDAFTGAPRSPGVYDPAVEDALLAAVSVTSCSADWRRREHDDDPLTIVVLSVIAARNRAKGERLAIGELVRDIFGNPFRPVAADPDWLTPTVVGLARGIYDAKAFDRLPVLADALEDAGCGHPDVLAHCRGPGPHVRGCWVVDLLLGKT